MRSISVYEAVLALKSGEVIVVPTDTVYGLAALCTSEKAIRKLYEAKGRPYNKPLIILISNIDMLKTVARNVPKMAIKLADRFWPGALSIILRKRKAINPLISANTQSIGVRIADCKLLNQLIDQLGYPLAVTSANLSGEKENFDFDSVAKALKKTSISVGIDGGESKHKIPSTIVDLSTNNLIILRQGAISDQRIRACINA